jgi:hypothetical protein
VLVNAGSSAGPKILPRVWLKNWKPVVHGVAVRPDTRYPGNDPAFCHRAIRRKPPSLASPGTRFLPALTGEIFVNHYWKLWQGRQPEQPVTVNPPHRKVTSPDGDDDFYARVGGAVGTRM